jgi:protein gp37
MSDLFHERIPESFIRQVFEIMEKASQHTFQILTKRHERLAELAPTLPWASNVWMGVTIENRRFVHRADREQARSALQRLAALRARVARGVDAVALVREGREELDRRIPSGE